MASIRPRRSHSSAKLHEQPERFVGDAILRIIEVQADRLEGQSLAAMRVICKQLAQVLIAKLVAMCRKRLPNWPCRERWSVCHASPPLLAESLF